MSGGGIRQNKVGSLQRTRLRWLGRRGTSEVPPLLFQATEALLSHCVCVERQE